MKALSIRQPWAWLIVNGHKPVENRTWPTGHRGDLLIHAGQVFDSEGLDGVLARFPELRQLLPQRYDMGGIVGRVSVVACVAQHPSPWFTGPWGFVMIDPRPTTLVPMPGKLGIFEVEPGDALQAALRRGPVQAGQQALFEGA